MSSTSNQVLPDPATRRSLLRHTLPVPLVLLLAACGGRYELGEVMQELDVDNPIAAKSIGSVIIDDTEDGDATTWEAPWDENAQSAGFLWSEANPVGDVNGDGYGDLICSSPDHWFDGKFDERLQYGGPRPETGVLTPNGPVVSRPDMGIQRPYARAAGDVDGDGYGDVIWYVFNSWGLTTDDDEGQPRHWSTSRDHKSYLLYGGPGHDDSELFLPDVAVTFESLADPDVDLAEARRRLALSPKGSVQASQYIDMVSVGDIDGDGFDDFTYTYVSKWDDVPSEATTYLFYGSAERLSGSALPARSAELSEVTRVTGLGDVDGDGFADFAAQLMDGEVAMMPGGPARLAGTVAVLDAGRRFEATAGSLHEGSSPVVNSAGYFGVDIQGLGDLDADGYADLTVTQTLTDGTARSYLFYGGANRLSQPFLVDYAQAAFDVMTSLFPSVPRPLGDWNGDGNADLLVELGRARSQPEYTQANYRRAGAVIPGGSSRYSGLYVVSKVEPDLALDDPTLLVNLQVHPLGDIDGDGRSDVMFGSQAGTMIKYGGPLSPTIY